MHLGLLRDGLPGRVIMTVAEMPEGGSLAHRVLLRNTTESPSEWAEVMRRWPREVAGFALDLGWGHRAAAGHVSPAVEEPARVYLRWADRVEAVILHDADDARVRLPLGAGQLAWRDLATALRESDIRAPLLLDVDGDPGHSVALARELFRTDL